MLWSISKPNRVTHNSKQDHTSQLYSTVSACDESFPESHKVSACPQFKNMSVPDKTNFARFEKLCFNWLQTGHSVSACSSKYTCRECRLKHRTLLHRDNILQANSSNQRRLRLMHLVFESEDKPQTLVVNWQCRT